MLNKKLEALLEIAVEAKTKKSPGEIANQELQNELVFKEVKNIKEAPIYDETPESLKKMHPNTLNTFMQDKILKNRVNIERLKKENPTAWNDVVNKTFKFAGDKGHNYKTEIDNQDSFENNADLNFKNTFNNKSKDFPKFEDEKLPLGIKTDKDAEIADKIKSLQVVAEAKTSVQKKQSNPYLNESYTQEDLLELFEALNLDTDKYTFKYLAEELGFVPEGEVEMEQPEMVEMEPSQDPGEYDEEGSMAKSQLITIADAAAELYNMMEDETNLPEWVQSKLTLAKEYIDTVRDYLKSEMIKQSEEIPAIETQPEIVEVPAEAVEMPVEQSLQERYVLKRPVGRPSKKSKMLDAKGATEVDSKGQVVYTNKKNGGK